MKEERRKRGAGPLDEGALERLALFYVGRYATTAARLKSYLQRKLRERGWAGAGEPALDAIVARAVALGFIDDQAFALARAEALQRRGYGARRTAQALRAAGVGDLEAEAARTATQAGAWAAVLRFAERKRIGPFATVPADRALKQRQFAAMMRAGHEIGIVRRILDARPGETLEYEQS